METNSNLSDGKDKYVPVPMHELTAHHINKLDPFR